MRANGLQNGAARLRRLLCLVLVALLVAACAPRVETAPEGGETHVLDDKYRNWYEVFVYSFADSDGDRYGDLNGLTAKLDYIAALGCNGIWLMPIMPSPSYHKYDVTDYYDIDPLYGTLDDFQTLLEEAHARGIDVIIDLVVNHGRIGEVYNIGGHNEMRNIDIVRLICRKLGKPESLITYVADRQGHDLRYAIDPAKIHAELGWLPETRFADGIGQTIDWYLAHRDWWEEIVSGEYQTYYARMYGDRPMA